MEKSERTVEKAFVDYMLSSGMYCVNKGNIMQWNDSSYEVVDKASLHNIIWNWLGDKASASKVESIFKSCTFGLQSIDSNKIEQNNYLVIPTVEYTLRMYDDCRLTISNSDSSFLKDPQMYHINVNLSKHLEDPFGIQYDNLPFEFKTLKQDSEFQTFLNTSVPDKKIQEWLSMFVGMSLTPFMDGSMKALWLIGDGSNGKSVFIDIVKALHGELRTTSIKPDELGPTHVSKVPDCSLIVCTEGSNKIDEENFKTLITGDTMKARRLYVDSFDFKNKAKVIISSNSVPLVKDKSSAVFRRIQFISFNQKITEKKIGLSNKIIKRV
jgi:hypothetical protein